MMWKVLLSAWLVSVAVCGANAQRIPNEMVPPNCDCDLDLMFLVDGSSSIGSEGFDQAKEYIAHFIDCYNCTNVGLIHCKCESNRSIPLCYYNNVPALVNAVEEVESCPSTTRVGYCIYYSQCTTQWHAGKANGRNTDDVAGYAENARNAGITVYAGAIGRSSLVNMNGLETISGSSSRVVDTTQEDPSWLASCLTIDNCEMRYRGFWNSIYDIWSNIKEEVRDFIDEVQGSVEEIITNAQDAINQAAQTVRDEIQSVIGECRSTIERVRDAALDILRDLFPFVNSVIQDIQDVICNIIDAYRVVEAIREYFERLVQEAFDAFCHYLESLIDGLKYLIDSFSFILPQGLENFLQDILGKAQLLLWLKRITRIFADAFGCRVCRFLWWLIWRNIFPFIFPTPFKPLLGIIP
uniref:VWFA domain-containing protein n=1 Tax=Branchiostoma floridae TaxID=7739 RepID=C3YTS1_BRAFL|eukprot:XP_002600186.1 hypothetical protein BRAFLDRAFT_66692 [Branchiostoma floridae]